VGPGLSPEKIVYQDTEKIAEALWDKRERAVEVDPAQFEEMFQRAEPGWDPFDFPGNYRWFLIKDFPVKDLDVTLARLMKDARDPGQEKFQHDRIIELWKKGRPFWPVFVTATGIIADGYHRTAAHRTLGHKTVDVVVSVATKREAYPLHQDEMWLEAFPKEEKEMKHLYSIEFFTENGEVDGYFAHLTDRQAEDVKDRLKKAADMYELGQPRVFKIDLNETPDFKTLMDTLEERYPS
jgi:hypothetical protein